MGFGGLGGKLAVAGLALVVGTGVSAGSADARPRSGGAHGGSVQVFRGGYASVHAVGRSGFGHRSYASARSYGGGGGGLQCVPFARANTGIELSGNAATWWASAAGVYERGARPEVGSILNFRATGRMHMGHVAVVSNVIDARTVEIDHANWSGHGSINRDINVVDVSPNNDWSAVRVALGHGSDFGSIYPTYGFIYDRPDRGVMVANAGVTPAPVLNPAPADLRPAADRMIAAAAPQEAEEVAEADSTDDDAPATRRFGRHLVRVHTHGTFHGRFAASGHAATRSTAASAAAPHAAAHVVRVHTATGRTTAARPHGRT